jgi:hypothetical protein
MHLEPLSFVSSQLHSFKAIFSTASVSSYNFENSFFLALLGLEMGNRIGLVDAITLLQQVAF